MIACIAIAEEHVTQFEIPNVAAAHGRSSILGGTAPRSRSRSAESPRLLTLRSLEPPAAFASTLLTPVATIER
jgi:hypothetical protein